MRRFGETGGRVWALGEKDGRYARLVVGLDEEGAPSLLEELLGGWTGLHANPAFRVYANAGDAIAIQDGLNGRNGSSPVRRFEGVSYGCSIVRADGRSGKVHRFEQALRGRSERLEGHVFDREEALSGKRKRQKRDKEGK